VNLDSLLRSLTAAGLSPQLLEGAGGARLVALPHGGRVIGLFADKNADNFLWTHPVLKDADQTRALIHSDAWHNTGGDRTWLAPEVDLFHPDYPDQGRYVQPREFDPGHYEAHRDGSGLRLENRFTALSYRTKENTRLHLVKRVSLLREPFHSRPELGEGLSMAGYCVRTSLAVLDGAERTALGLWHLLQLPHGGDMLIPTTCRTEPKIFFGEVPDGELRVGERLVRYHMRTPGAHKIGIKCTEATGRLAYLWRRGRCWSAVIRSFLVNPSGLYVDCPWDDASDMGYAVEACNVAEPEFGRFSELEYHVPAIGAGTGEARCEDVSHVWAFRGPRVAVRRAVRALLGVCAP